MKLSFDRIPKIPPELDTWAKENAPQLGVWMQDLIVFLYEWNRRIEVAIDAKYDLAAMIDGIPSSGADFMQFPAVRSYRLPAALLGSYVKCDVAPTATATLTIYKNAGSVGSMTIAAGATSGTFSFPNAVTFNPGDVLAVTLSSATDATLEDVSFMLKADPL